MMSAKKIDIITAKHTNTNKNGHFIYTVGNKMIVDISNTNLPYRVGRRFINGDFFGRIV